METVFSKKFILVLLILIFSLLNLFSNEKNNFINHSDFSFEIDHGIPLFSYSIPLGKGINTRTGNTKSFSNAYGYGGLIFVMATFPIIGGLLILTGIPLLAVGCVFYEPSIPAGNTDVTNAYLGLIISGSVCLGLGVLMFIPFIICLIWMQYN